MLITTGLVFCEGTWHSVLGAYLAKDTSHVLAQPPPPWRVSFEFCWGCWVQCSESLVPVLSGREEPHCLLRLNTYAADHLCVTGEATLLLTTSYYFTLTLQMEVPLKESGQLLWHVMLKNRMQ